MQKLLTAAFTVLLGAGALLAQSTSIVTVMNGNYACVSSNVLVIVTASTADATITLPPATASGQTLTVVVKDGTKNVTVVKNASDGALVDPSGGAFMGGGCSAGEAVSVTADGAAPNPNWYVTMTRNSGCANWAANAPAATATGSVPKGTGIGQTLYWNGSKWVTLGAGASGTVLQANGNAAPAWQFPTSLNGGLPSGAGVFFGTLGPFTGFTYSGVSNAAYAGDAAWGTKSSANFTARYGAAACVVNGIVYVSGGQTVATPSPVYSSLVEAYDPVANLWTTKASLSSARDGHACATVNGKIYAFGGATGTTGMNVVEEYDPTANTWTAKTAMPTARYALGAAAVNGKIYCCGGLDGATIYDKNEEYDPLSDTWATKQSMSSVRQSHGCEALNGKVYVMGGINASTIDGTIAEYNPVTNTWTGRGSLNTARLAFAHAVANGKIYSAGGLSGSGISNAVEEYDPTGAGTSTNRTNTSFTARMACDGAWANGQFFAMAGTTAFPLTNASITNLNQAVTFPLTIYYFFKD